MRLEFIDRVKEKEVLGKSIFTNDGGVLLRAGITLTNAYIARLKELGVLFLYIEDERLEDVKLEDEHLSKMKHEAIKKMAKIMKNLNNFKNDNMKGSFTIVEDMVNYILEVGDVTKSLYDIQTYDNYTYVHSVDTGIMAIFLGLSLNIHEKELKELAIGAILHDIGKMQIPLQILQKRNKLTDKEHEEFKKHTLYGKQILSKNLNFSDIVLKTIEQHHERIDGKGYPYGLLGNQISKYAKITSICDVYNSTSNKRFGKDKFSPIEAYELILAGSGSSFDEKMVKKFRSTFAVYPLGICVKLSNGIEGYVIRQNPEFPDRPVIRVLYDEVTKKPVPFYEIDLVKKPNVVIVDLVR